MNEDQGGLGLLEGTIGTDMMANLFVSYDYFYV